MGYAIFLIISNGSILYREQRFKCLCVKLGLVYIVRYKSSYVSDANYVITYLSLGSPYRYLENEIIEFKNNKLPIGLL